MAPKKVAKKKVKRQAGGSALSDAFKFAKEHKLISKGLAMIPHPAGQALAYIAKMTGMGIKVPSKIKNGIVAQHGEGIFSDIGGLFGGIGSGVGSVAHGFFGNGMPKHLQNL